MLHNVIDQRRTGSAYEALRRGDWAMRPGFGGKGACFAPKTACAWLSRRAGFKVAKWRQDAASL
ncbi:MAG: hypothetical protein AUK50_06065 [Comamonadaceae bacterium CG2_30_57_122]|nr:MAG: hypothetical protein AUK50_06065 [Comamonadaceae bacterium CG2_30_57_122]